MWGDSGPGYDLTCISGNGEDLVEDVGCYLVAVDCIYGPDGDVSYYLGEEK